MRAEAIESADLPSPHRRRAHTRMGPQYGHGRRPASLLALLWITWACSTWLPATATTARPGTPGPATEEAAATVTVAPSEGLGCYYTWATRELPELSATFQVALSGLAPGLSGSAYAFGEDCLRSNRPTEFLAMETDFRVRVPVASMEDRAILGSWIAKVMQVVDGLPASDLAGPRPGRVEFEFLTPASESLRLIVEISRYHLEGQGLEGAALFEHFNSSP